MRRLTVLSCVLIAAAASASTAQADSTVTQTLAPGESMRSSPDAAPSAATPVIAVVTVKSVDSTSFPPPTTTSVTIALKDRADTRPGDTLEGPSGYVYIGPKVTVSVGESLSKVSVVYEVDSSQSLPGFLVKKTGGSADQFMYHRQDPDDRSDEFVPSLYGKVEKFGDGDFRLTPEGGRGFFRAEGSFDLLQQAFYANPYPSFEVDLQDALRKGVGVYLQTNYAAKVEWTVKVSAAVARKLKLKSTTIGSKTFAKPGGETRRVPLTAAARKALKRYKRVTVTLQAEATGPNGQVIKKTKSSTLTTESELD